MKEPRDDERSEEPVNEEPASNLGFTWRTTKSGDVEVMRGGRTVAKLRGRTASAFVLAAERLEAAEIQQRLARLTGNYARGNERAARRHPRNR